MKKFLVFLIIFFMGLNCGSNILPVNEDVQTQELQKVVAETNDSELSKNIITYSNDLIDDNDIDDLAAEELCCDDSCSCCEFDLEDLELIEVDDELTLWQKIQMTPVFLGLVCQNTQDHIKDNKEWYILGSMLAIVGAGTASVYFVKKKKR